MVYMVNIEEKNLSWFFFWVKPPTSKRSVGGTFQSGGVDSPPDSPMFQLVGTSSLRFVVYFSPGGAVSVSSVRKKLGL